MSSSDKESAGPQRRSILKQIAAVAGGLPFAPGLVSGIADWRRVRHNDCTRSATGSAGQHDVVFGFDRPQATRRSRGLSADAQVDAAYADHCS